MTDTPRAVPADPRQRSACVATLRARRTREGRAVPHRRLTLIAALVVAAAAVGGMAAPKAWAHAVLVDSTPRADAVLRHSPRTVVFRFNEPVEATFGSVRVYDQRGERVDDGRAFQPPGRADAIAVRIGHRLAPGRYVAVYRVVSADSHPVAGGIAFAVGRGDADGPSVAELVDRSTTAGSTRFAFAATRWLSYLAAAVVVGCGLLAFFGGSTTSRVCQRRGRAPSVAELAEDHARGAAGLLLRRSYTVATAAALVGAAAALVALVCQAATASGRDLVSAVEPALLVEVTATRFGLLWAARAVVLGLAGCVAVFGLIRGRGNGVGQFSRRPVLLAGVLAAVAASLSPIAGHAAAAGLLVKASSVAHALAASVWFGGVVGLVALAPAATRSLPETQRSRLLAQLVGRFATVAALAAGLLAGAGAVQALDYLAAPSDVLESTFGRLLGVKTLAFAAILLLGWLNRYRLLPALRARAAAAAAPGQPGWTLRRSLRAEAGAGALALLATALLVAEPPPTTGDRGPVSASVTAGSRRFEVTVDPARVGANAVHVYVLDARSGAPAPSRQRLALYAVLDSERIGPLALDTERAGPGHWVARALLPARGKWRIVAALRTSVFDEQRVTIEVPVR